MNEKVLVIAGPTAVGKTSLSIELAKRFNGEIISGDSMQVYTSLDIGTAKITKEEMNDVPHHLIDCRDLNETYSAADFQKEGRACIESISKRGRLPIVVGGTGLYIQTLLYDFALGETVIEDNSRRDYWQKYAEEHGNQALWEVLKERDAKAAEHIHPNNQQRLIRALEVADNGGHIWQEREITPLYKPYMIALNTDRAVLYDRINQRVDCMMEQGLLEEAKMVYQAGDVQGAKAIGYKEFFSYFRGEMTLDEAVEKLKQNSRRYAKRQLTWFRNRMEMNWIDLVQHPEDKEALIANIQAWLEED